MNAEKALGKILWSFSLADGGATAIMRDLAQNELLTDSERAFAGTTLWQQEIEHADLSAKWAKKLGVPRAPGYDPYSAIALRDTMVIRRVADPVLKTAWTLAGLRWNEEASVRAFPRWVKLFSNLGYRDMASDFIQLVGEEKSHVAFGVAAAQRLMNDNHAFEAAYKHYYKLTAHAGLGILAATFSEPLRKLENHAGPEQL
jgi:hypothetical protein